MKENYFYTLLFIALLPSVTFAQQNFPPLATGYYHCTITQNSTYQNTMIINSDIIVTADTSNQQKFNMLTPNLLSLGTYTMDTIPNRFSYYYSSSHPLGPFSSDSRFGVFYPAIDSLYFFTRNVSAPPYFSWTGSHECKKRLATNLEEEERRYFRIYPNPVQEELQIQGEFIRLEYEIFSIEGKKLLSGTLSNGQSIRLNTLPKGTYHLRFGQGALLEHKTFIKN